MVTHRRRTRSVEEGKSENKKASRAQDMGEDRDRWVEEFVPIFSLMLVKMSRLSG